MRMPVYRLQPGHEVWLPTWPYPVTVTAADRGGEELDVRVAWQTPADRGAISLPITMEVPTR